MQDFYKLSDFRLVRDILCDSEIHFISPSGNFYYISDKWIQVRQVESNSGERLIEMENFELTKIKKIFVNRKETVIIFYSDEIVSEGTASVWLLPYKKEKSKLIWKGNSSQISLEIFTENYSLISSDNSLRSRIIDFSDPGNIVSFDHKNLPEKAYNQDYLLWFRPEENENLFLEKTEGKFFKIMETTVLIMGVGGGIDINIDDCFFSKNGSTLIVSKRLENNGDLEYDFSIYYLDKKNAIQKIDYRIFSMENDFGPEEKERNLSLSPQKSSVVEDRGKLIINTIIEGCFCKYIFDPLILIEDSGNIHDTGIFTLSCRAKYQMFEEFQSIDRRGRFLVGTKYHSDQIRYCIFRKVESRPRAEKLMIKLMLSMLHLGDFEVLDKNGESRFFNSEILRNFSDLIDDYVIENKTKKFELFTQENEYGTVEDFTYLFGDILSGIPDSYPKLRAWLQIQM